MALAEIPGLGTWTERAQKVMRTPVGAVSPLWMAFGAAATAGAAYWWLTQWTRAVNVEALASLAAKPAKPTAPVKIEVEAPAAVVEAAVIEAAPVVDAEPEFLPEPEPVVEAPAAPVVEAAPPAADDLTRMSGIGRKLSEALAARGVTRFAQIAGWTAADLDAVDKALSLKGRAVREAWVAQARRLAAAE